MLKVPTRNTKTYKYNWGFVEDCPMIFIKHTLSKYCNFQENSYEKHEDNQCNQNCKIFPIDFLTGGLLSIEYITDGTHTYDLQSPYN